MIHVTSVTILANSKMNRPQSGHDPRDPSVPASSDPTSRVRLAEEPFDVYRPSHDVERVEAEAVEPEQLTAEQAESRRKAKSSSLVQAGNDPDLIEASRDNPPEIIPVEDEQAVVPVPDPPSWTKYDIGTALQLLRSVRPGVVRRTLRKLHIRWYHAPTKRMTTLLNAAGVPVEVINQVNDIVTTCDLCRAWSKPGPRSMTSSRLPEKFNQEVEIDLLFVGNHVILHMVDRCIRWSAGVKIPDRTTDSILNGIKDGWISVFGAPGCLVSDQGRRAQ